MTPPLSVIVVSFNDAGLLAGCLASLKAQVAAVGAEVIVVANWRADGQARARLDAALPDMRWIDAPVGDTVPAMRRRAMAASQGAIVAIIEDDCEASPDWCRAVLAAHQSPDVAIGGAVEPGPYRSGIDWAVYFHDYGRFMPPMESRATPDLAGNNVAYKRAVLDALPAGEDFYDAVVHARWAAEGLSMRRDGTLVVRQVNSWRWRDVTSAPFHHARGYAGQRFPSRAWPWRAGAAGLALLLPLLSTARIMRTVAGHGRHLGRLFQALPWIGAYAVAWSLGESVGYLAGPGRSLARWR